MELSYFLGANSKDGFASLYRGFAAGESDRLHIIKGGPGTGITNTSSSTQTNPSRTRETLCAA